MTVSTTRPLLIALVLLLIGFTLPAQNRFKKQADEQFKQLAYASATKYYKKALTKEFDPDCIIKLAECYRLMNDYEQAAIWYEKVMQLQNKPSLTLFYYGHSLLQSQQYDQARLRFQQFADANPDDPRGKNFVDAIDRMETLMRDSARFEIENLPFNTDASDFGAIPWGGGLVFASSRDEGSVVSRDFEWLDAPYLNLFHTEFKEDAKSQWGKPIPLKGALNTRYHESNFTWSKDSDIIYFNRNNFFERKKGKNQDGVILLKIYEATMEGLNAKDLSEFPYNNDNYSMGHPALSSDGKQLYLVSDKPGGEGGTDIYVCSKTGTGWGKPVNLGPVINTPGNEMFPNITKEGILYFSSNGHPGMGHLDLFITQKQSDGTWGTVENMGAPLNSPYDDFALSMEPDGRRGYFTSNRPGGKGDDDIYRFEPGGATVEVIVLDSVAQLPIEGAQVRVLDYEGGAITEYVTDSAGRILFNTENGKNFHGRVMTTEFPDKELDMSTESETGQTFFSYLVELYNPPPAISAIVIDEVTKERLPGSVIYFKDIETDSVEKRVADKNGRFAIKLGVTKSYNLLVTHDGYLNYTDLVSTTEYRYDGDTIIPLRMEKIRFNEPIVLENIHYDFDLWDIRGDAIPELLKLKKLLQDNPQLRIELSSHTDCRGSDPYNEVLSKKRALSARQFLLKQGVQPDQIIAKGYGETKLINRCDDGVECTEDEHFANRRTEFKILGIIAGIDAENSILETSEVGKPPPVYVPENKKADFNSPTLPRLPFKKGAKPGQMVYRVQIGMYPAPLTAEDLKKVFEYQDFTFEVEENGIWMYQIGDYYKRENALRALRQLKGYGYSVAKIRRFRDGMELE